MNIIELITFILTEPVLRKMIIMYIILLACLYILGKLEDWRSEYYFGEDE